MHIYITIYMYTHIEMYATIIKKLESGRDPRGA